MGKRGFLLQVHIIVKSRLRKSINGCFLKRQTSWCPAQHSESGLSAATEQPQVPRVPQGSSQALLGWVGTGVDWARRKEAGRKNDSSAGISKQLKISKMLLTFLKFSGTWCCFISFILYTEFYCTENSCSHGYVNHTTMRRSTISYMWQLRPRLILQRSSRSV